MKTFQRILALIMILAICMACSINAFATDTHTGVYLGTGTQSGPVSFTDKGYVYYTSNNASQLSVYSLVQSITNTGGYAVDWTSYEVTNNKHTKDTQWSTGITDITYGNTRRIERTWGYVCYLRYGSYNTTYYKNSPGYWVYTDECAGNSDLNLAGWECFWYRTTHSADFHY